MCPFVSDYGTIPLSKRLLATLTSMLFAADAVRACGPISAVLLEGNGCIRSSFAVAHTLKMEMPALVAVNIPCAESRAGARSVDEGIR